MPLARHGPKRAIPAFAIGNIEQMREDRNRRAREDANYYVAFATLNDEEFLATGARSIGGFEAELYRLPRASEKDRRALEIGCGPGRLMIPTSKHFGEIHGVDISDEMVALAKQKIAGTGNAHVYVNSGFAALPAFEAVEFHSTANHSGSRYQGRFHELRLADNFPRGC